MTFWLFCVQRCRVEELLSSPMALFCSYFLLCSQLQQSFNASCSACFSVAPILLLRVLPSSILLDICRMHLLFSGRSTCVTGRNLLLYVFIMANDMANPSVCLSFVCLSSVTCMHPTQGV